MGGVHGGVGGIYVGDPSSLTGTSFFGIEMPAITAAANSDFYRMRVRTGSNAVTTAGSGTHNVISTLMLNEPNITGSNVTNSAVIYIYNAATEATNDYAIFVDDGAVRFDDRTFSIGGVVYEFPASVNAGTYLKTDGSGNLSWAAATASATGSGTTGDIVKWTDGAAGTIGDSVMVESSSNIGIGG